VEAPPPVPPPLETPEAPVPATVPSLWGPTMTDENVVAETAPPPQVARPRLSAAIGMGSSFDSVGFRDGVHPIPSFFTVLGIGDGLLGLDLSAFASSASREERMMDSPIDRLAVDLFGVVRERTSGVRKTIPLRFVADDDVVVIEARGEMTSRTGVPYNNEYCLIYRLRDGKIVEITEYNDSVLCERVLGPFSASE